MFFFFKQKTAYEIMPSLVGSEMCIRDRDMDGFVFPEDPSTDRQFLSDIGGLMNYGRTGESTLEVVPPPLVKTHPDHQVRWQGTGVVAKGVPADREIQFFGFPDYQGQGEEEASGEEDGVDYLDYSYDEEERMQDVKDEEDEEEEGTSSGGMSNVEKALVAAEVCLLYTSDAADE